MKSQISLDMLSLKNSKYNINVNFLQLDLCLIFLK